MSNSFTERARPALLSVTAVLDDIGVPYFLAYGTALGAYRDSGFTPTETDIDIGFLAESFVPMAMTIRTRLLSVCALYSLTEPFNRCWAIKAHANDVNIDLVSNAVWQDKRFNPSVVHDFCHVHTRPMLENYETVEVFGKKFLVPSPIEQYLEELYGPKWYIPKLDTAHRNRVDGFMRHVPVDLLEQYDTRLS